MHKLKVIAFTTLFALSFLVILPTETVSATETTSFDYYIPITIKNTYVETEMTNYPFLVKIVDNASMYEKINDTSFNDIAFFSNDNITQFAHDIEYADHGGGVVNLIVWVNISDAVPSDTDYTFYMYFGNSTIEDQRDMDNTWGDEFTAVYHHNMSSGSLYDSSGNGYHATANGTAHYQETGKIGYSVGHGGKSSWFSIVNSSSFHFSNGEWTVLSWAYSNVTVENKEILSKGTIGAGGIRWELLGLSNDHALWDPGESRIGIDNNAVEYNMNGSGVNNSDKWSMHTFMRDNDVTAGHDWIYLFNNGTLLNSTDMGDYTVPLDMKNSHLMIGQGPGGAASDTQWQGYLDEMWVMVGETVSNEWINTTYNNHELNDLMMVFGPMGEPEVDESPVNSNPSPANGATGVELPLTTYSTTASDPQGDTMNVYLYSNHTLDGSWYNWKSNNGGNDTYIWIGSHDGSGNFLGMGSGDLNYSTTYYWSVNTTDGNGNWDNDTYYFTTQADPDDYSLSINKTCNRTYVNLSEAVSPVLLNYTLTITNTGSYNLTNVIINETWHNCSCSDWNWTVESLSFGVDNITFFPCYALINVSQIDDEEFEVEEEITLWMVINITACDNTTVSDMWNYANVSTTEGATDSDSNFVEWGRTTTTIRITAPGETTSLTDISTHGTTVFSIIGIVMVIGAILAIVGMVKKFGLF